MILARISKRFAPAPDSAGFSLDIEFEAQPGVTVLFGASGAGKTLTLDSIAGFSKPDAGRILLDDKIVFDAAASVNLRPQDRHCGYVFQNYALFPHMTVRQNLAFAAEPQPRLERHRRVAEMMERFHLVDLAGRRPHELSGGQKQRCSIARALIGSPKVLLLDEPARGLDVSLRAELYTLIRALRADFRIPILLVTHDLEECFALGDTLLIYDSGRIIQSGPPQKALDRPASSDVARLLGFGNVFDAEILALDPGRNTSRIRARDREFYATYFPGHLLGARIALGVRSGDVRVHSAPGDNRMPAKLSRVVEQPRGVRLEFADGLVADVSRYDYAQQRDNQEWYLELPPDAFRPIGK